MGESCVIVPQNKMTKFKTYAFYFYEFQEEEEEEEEEESQEVQQTSRRSSFSAEGHVPTPDECASFRQSFDSATSMVFHRRTGLPLTSSPAPLRRGRDKFDFDDSITSPHDIKKALFAKKSGGIILEKSNASQTGENKENINGCHEPTSETKTATVIYFF